MGLWECKDGTMVEMIFDEEGKFVKFGDDISKENAEKAENEIMVEHNQQVRHSQLVDMIDKDIPVEEIALKCGEDSCVSDYKLQIPNWCHEDADCHECWIKCLEKEFFQE